MKRHRHSDRDGDYLPFWQMVREGQVCHLKWEHRAAFRSSNPPLKRERERLHALAHKRAVVASVILVGPRFVEGTAP